MGACPSCGQEPPVKSYPDGYGCSSIDTVTANGRNVMLRGMQLEKYMEGCKEKTVALGSTKIIGRDCYCFEDLCNRFPLVWYYTDFNSITSKSDEYDLVDTLGSSKSDVHCSDLALGSALLTSSLLFLFQTLA
ncbi:uncharacterized protein LOC143030702 [Oratosquilla oratoria]|uniref:uncharacterized protein LOC143030702 n=1 Tax=Oratosquilla oratoria TaxID=337810 RepID=UPI003F765676